MIRVITWKRGIILAMLALLLTACALPGGGSEPPAQPTEAGALPPAPTPEATAQPTAEETKEGGLVAEVGDPTPTASPVQGAFDQSQIAAEHSQLAADALASGDLPGAQRHAEHVINIIVGEAGDAEAQFGIGFGDHNGDGTPENPGDGFGVWPYTNEALLQVDNTIEASDTGAETRERLGEARVCLVNLRTQETLVLAQAQLLLAATTPEEAQAPSDAMVAASTAGSVGFDASGNTVVDLLPGECGSQQALEIVTEFAPALLEFTVP